MAYNPNLYNPYQQAPMYVQQNQAPINGLVYLDSIEDAKNYQMPPGSVSPPLIIKSDEIFIIKTTDGSGGGRLNAYKFEEIPLPTEGSPGSDYVTKKDLDAFMAQIMEAINGKQPIPEVRESGESGE